MHNCHAQGRTFAACEYKRYAALVLLSDLLLPFPSGDHLGCPYSYATSVRASPPSLRFGTSYTPGLPSTGTCSHWHRSASRTPARACLGQHAYLSTRILIRGFESLGSLRWDYVPSSMRRQRERTGTWTYDFDVAALFVSYVPVSVMHDEGHAQSRKISTARGSYGRDFPHSRPRATSTP